MPKFDLTKPFLAIQRRPRVDREEKDMAELIVNPLSEPIIDVVLATSGLEGGAVGIGADRCTDRISASKYAELGFSTREEFDDMVCDWTLTYRVGEQQYRVEFLASKGLWNCAFVEELPYIGGRGHVVPMSTEHDPSWDAKTAFLQAVTTLPHDVRATLATERSRSTK